jgi:hypothetical protein
MILPSDVRVGFRDVDRAKAEQFLKLTFPADGMIAAAKTKRDFGTIPTWQLRYQANSIPRL